MSNGPTTEIRSRNGSSKGMNRVPEGNRSCADHPEPATPNYRNESPMSETLRAWVKSSMHCPGSESETIPFRTAAAMRSTDEPAAAVVPHGTESRSDRTGRNPKRPTGDSEPGTDPVRTSQAHGSTAKRQSGLNETNPVSGKRIRRRGSCLAQRRTAAVNRY